MTPAGAFLKWFAVGTVVAGLLVVGQAQAVEGPAGLLQVGEMSALRPLIEGELGEVPLAPGPGHDGQIYYAIGLDLLGREVPDLLDHGAYRYRRIAFPAVAAVGGLLDGYPLLYSMVILTGVSTGLASGAVGALAVRGRRSDWYALAVVANPGVWLSIRLLTADVMALAAMTLALLAFGGGRRLGIGAFSLSGLSKDVYLTTPAGLALRRDPSTWPYLLVPLAALVAWMTWLTMSMGEGFSGRGNLAWPFTGITSAIPVWSSFDLAEWTYLIFALASVGAGLAVGLTRRSWLRWSILLWCGLAITSSSWVWDLGNNAARAFAPIVVLTVLSYAPTGRASPDLAITSRAGV